MELLTVRGWRRNVVYYDLITQTNIAAKGKKSFIDLENYYESVVYLADC